MTTNRNLGWISGFIGDIADDVLRDVFKGGKCRDVILPMVIIRRLNPVLEQETEGLTDQFLVELGTRNESDRSQAT